MYKSAASERACIWAKENRERHNNNARRYRELNPVPRLYQSAKSRAKELDIEFSITKEDIIIPDECPILKVPFVRRTLYAPSLDRINPALGYVPGNVQVITRKANVMKNNATHEELKRFAEWINQLKV